jgi:hypothetical protein
MAAPVITNVTGVPTSQVAPGQAVDLTVQVSDADTRGVTVELVVVNPDGTKSDAKQVSWAVADNVSVDPTGTKIVTGGGTLTITGALSVRHVG